MRAHVPPPHRCAGEVLRRVVITLQSYLRCKQLCAANYFAKLKQKSKTAKFSAKKILLPTQKRWRLTIRMAFGFPPSGWRSASASPRQPAFTTVAVPPASPEGGWAVGLVRGAVRWRGGSRAARERPAVAVSRVLRRQPKCGAWRKIEGAGGRPRGNETFCQTYCLTGISPRNTARPF